MTKLRTKLTLVRFLPPVGFPEANLRLNAPKGWDEKNPEQPCDALPVHELQNGYMSLWKASLAERLLFLFHGKIWLQVLSPAHPPVAVGVGATAFIPIAPRKTRRAWWPVRLFKKGKHELR